MIELKEERWHFTAVLYLDRVISPPSFSVFYTFLFALLPFCSAKSIACPLV
ncbi:Uncharacterized protein APZ42_014358 [Daphnia magna]|uniref:Uncharacterized protein n=1 Tax=Daphnia magna TaxID=35525 RepID=A0A162Q810_9CRUS|nr:Uncharacterized protein APZ42_014358 [Daphnia magna]